MSFRALFCLFGALLVSSFGNAQLATSSGVISGVVEDPGGRAMPNVSVNVKNADWNFNRGVVTGPDGTFSAVSLPPGLYLVQAAAKGFAMKGKPPRLTLSSGASIRITLQMGIAGKNEKITVTATGRTVEGNTLPPEVDKNEPVESNAIAGLNVTYLPTRDRDFLQFGQLSAATGLDRNEDRLVIAGQHPEYTRAIVDGADFTDPVNGGVGGSHDVTIAFPQTAVRDFQVIEAGGSADIGGTNSGLVKVATKSGTNKFRGEGFYIGRPSGLTSGDAFGHSLANSQNQFGGSIGGPVKNDKIFYYLGSEQDYLNNPFWTQFQPQPPGVAIPNSLISQQVQTVAKSSSTLLFAKADFILPLNNTLDLQANFNQTALSNAGYGSTRIDSAPSYAENIGGHDLWVRANLASVYGRNLVNQALVQWSANHHDISPASSAPEVDILGFGVLGGNATDPYLYSAHREQLSDDLAYMRGRLILHAGADFAHVPIRMQREANLNGLFTFSSLADYLSESPLRFQQTFVEGDTQFRGTIETFGLYATAKAQIAQNLAITAGLRWDGQWNPNSQTADIPDDLKQFQPRLGIAWSPSRNTVIRASAGLYDAFSPAMLYHRAIADSGANTVTLDSYFDPALLSLASTPQLHALSVVPLGITVPNAQIFGIDAGFRNPRSFQASASIEREISKDAAVSLGYLRNSTWALPLLADRNLFSPTFDASGLPIFPAARPDTAVGRALIEDSSAHSSYDAMLVKLKLQLTKRSNLAANYTLARSRDNDGSFEPFGLNTTMDPFDISLDEGPSNFDVRHTFNVSGIFNLPLGLKVNPVLLARSEAPYTPVVGFDLQNDANDWNDRAQINAKIASRNQFRQPAFFNLDLRFVKDFTLKGEGHHLDLFLDVFNVTHASNRNFGPWAISDYGAGTPFFSAGIPLYAPDSTRFGGARQVQFTARIVAF